MSVAQIFDQTAPLVSGYSMRSKYLTDHLRALGVPLRVYSSPIFTYPGGDETRDNVPYTRSLIRNWETVRKIPLYRETRIIRALEKTLLDNWHDDIRLVDAHSSLLNGIAGARVSRKKKVPLLYEIRALWEDAAVDQGKTREGSPRYRMTRHLETRIINRADHVTVICEGLKNDLLARGVAEAKITVIPNGVDTDTFQPLDPDEGLREKYNLRDKTVFGFIGTFFYFEGLEFLIRAAKIILNSARDVKFLLVGSGQEHDRLKRLTRELDLEDKVIFTGRVPHGEIRKYYSVVDVFVYPRISRRVTELVTPLKPLEAMAMEKIVMGSDVGGIRELVKEGENGVLFEAEDQQALAEKCLHVLAHRGEMKALALNARRYALEHRGWKKICERYFRIYEKLGVNVK
jgi:PEP-CTERM/exosortase A-associated glycosyltransferase